MKGIVLAIGGLALGVVAVAAIRELALANEALAVVVGVICGIAAAIPTSILLLVVLTRAERRQLDDQKIERLEAAGCRVEETQGPGGQVVYIVSHAHPEARRQLTDYEPALLETWAGGD